jgi:hypothetical protein
MATHASSRRWGTILLAGVTGRAGLLAALFGIVIGTLGVWYWLTSKPSGGTGDGDTLDPEHAPSGTDVPRVFGPAAAAEIARCTKQEDFLRILSDLPQRQGIWNTTTFPTTLQRFFEAWFAVDLQGALQGVALIPEPSKIQFFSTGFMRSTALEIGGKSRFAEAPGEFFKAANELLPEGLGNGVKGTVSQALATENPVALFEFAENKLGQGDDKTVAIRLLFANWSKSDPRAAISHAKQLAFEEDRRRAYQAMRDNAADWTDDEFKLAEAEGVPQDILKYIAIKRQEAKSRKK